MSNFPKTLTVDFDEALRNFNFVAGVVYKNDELLSIPLHSAPQAWVCDCLQWETGTDWRDAEIRPVRAEDLGEALDYMPQTLRQRLAALGRPLTAYLEG